MRYYRKAGEVSSFVGVLLREKVKLVKKLVGDC